MKETYKIEEYNNEQSFEQLYQDLMERVWKSGYEKQSMTDMDIDFLEWILNSSERNIKFNIKKQNKIVSFIGGFRRKIIFFNQELETYIGGLFSVHPEHQRKGLGYSQFLKRAKEIIDKRKCPCFFIYQDKGHSSTLLLKKFAQKENYGVKRLATFNFYVKMLDLKKVNQCEPLKFYEKILLLKPFKKWIEKIKIDETYFQNISLLKEEGLEQCQELLNLYSKDKKIKLARIWDNREELSRQLSFKKKAETLIFKKNNQVKGLINYYYMTLRGKTNIKVAFLDNLYLKSLSQKEQESFLSFYLKHIKKQECSAVISCNFAYFNRKIFRKFHFVQYPRYMHFIAIGRKDYLSQLKKLKRDEIYLDLK